MDFSRYKSHWIGLFLWFVTDVYSSWLYGNWVIELLVDVVILIFIQWLLNQFMLGC